MTFEDIEFDAQNASAGAPGASSVAVFVSTSQGISFDRVTMVAGSANDGAPGGCNRHRDQLVRHAARVCGAQREQRRGRGRGAEQTVHVRRPIADLRRTGRRADEHPVAWLPERRRYADAGAGAGGMQRHVMRKSVADRTERGRCAGPRREYAQYLARHLLADWLAAGCWSPGADGKPGQGGGGGGNGSSRADRAAAGACGGCGGGGGQGGPGGGASIALLSFQSSIALADCTLTAGAAGNGGAGSTGEGGQAGGSPGNGSGAGAGVGCPGGAGGAGAGGNGGQGGPGGLSLGIGYVGTPPTIDGAVVTQASTHSGITIGAAGAGGAGGLRGASATNSTGPAGALGASGQPGVAAAVEAVP